MRTQFLRTSIPYPGRAIATLAAAGIIVIIAAGPAAAHAHLVAVSPANGTTVTSEPTKVGLTFDEKMRAPANIVVTDPAGARVTQGAAQVVDKIATVQIQVTTAGRYTVAFRVVSADGHPVVGTTTFTYRAAAAASPSAPAVSPSVPIGEGSASALMDGHPAGHEEESGSTIGWVIGGVGGLALLGGVVLLTVRRRRLETSPGTETRDPA